MHVWAVCNYKVGSYMYFFWIRHGGPIIFRHRHAWQCIYPHVPLSTCMFSSIYFRLSLLWPTYLPCFCVETYSSYKTNLGSAIWHCQVGVVVGWFFALFCTTCLGRSYNFVSLELTDFTCFLLLQLPCMCLRFPRHIVGIIFSKYDPKEYTPEN